MSNVLLLGIALGFPVVLLVGVMWLARLEDRLPATVRAAQRRPDPAPILAMPVRPAMPIHVPVSVAEVPVTEAPVPAEPVVPEPVVAGRSVPEQRQPVPAPVLPT